MVGILILGMVLIGMTGAIGYLMLATNHSTTNLLNAADERTLLLQWENRIIASARKASSSDFVALPLGVDFEVAAVKQYHALPDWLIGGRNNSWGRPLLYCPYSPNGALGTATNIPLDSTTSYQVTLSSFSVDGVSRSYVTASDAPPYPGVLAFIISLLPGEAASCDDVTIDSDGQYILPSSEGVVRAITVDTVAISHRLLEPLYVDAYTAADDTEDHAINDFESVQNWQGSKPGRTVIYFKDRATDYKLSDLSFLSDQIHRSKEIVFKGESRAGVTLASTATGTLRSLSFNGLSVRLEHLTLDADVRLELNNSNVILSDVSLSNIAATGSSLSLDGNIYLTGNAHMPTPFLLFDTKLKSQGHDISIVGISGNSALLDARNSDLLLESGSVDLTYASQIPGLFLGQNSYLLSDGVSMTVTSSSTTKAGTMVSVGYSAKADFIDSTFLANKNIESSLFVSGEARLDNTTLDFTANGSAGITIGAHGVLSLDSGSRIGASGGSLVKPQIAVDDMGARFIFGASAAVHAQTKCWQGNVFKTVASDTTGSSVPTNATHEIFNQSNWSCNP